MRKAEIVEHVVANTTLSRSQAMEAIAGVFGAIEKSLCKGESVYVRGFATFKAYTKKARKGHDFKNGTSVDLPERNFAKLVLSKELKEKLNGNYGHGNDIR